MKSRLLRLGNLFAFFALTACAVPHGPGDQTSDSSMRAQPALASTVSPRPGFGSYGILARKQIPANSTKKAVSTDPPTSLADAPPLETGPDISNFHQTGRASWYGTPFHGRKTASGERYNMHALTAAHKTLPLDSYVRVTNTTNNKSVVVKINDRGPYTRGRVIDVSYAAARMLGLRRAGTARVKIEGLSQEEAKTEQAETLADNAFTK
jgi:rare lipoprotein A